MTEASRTERPVVEAVLLDLDGTLYVGDAPIPGAVEAVRTLADSLERDPSVLYVSTHQYPYYPGTGAADEVGREAGRGFTRMNLRR